MQHCLAKTQADVPMVQLHRQAQAIVQLALKEQSTICNEGLTLQISLAFDCLLTSNDWVHWSSTHIVSGDHPSLGVIEDGVVCLVLQDKHRSLRRMATVFVMDSTTPSPSISSSWAAAFLG